MTIHDLWVNMPGETVKGVDLEIRRGEILGIGGLSGHGKIGISNGIMGIYPSHGEVIWKGQPLNVKETAKTLQEGEDAGLITTGITTIEGIKACEVLKKMGIHVRHLHMPTVKPIDRDAITELAKTVPVIVTVENHSVVGGLGSAVAEVLCETQPARLIRLGLQDHFGETATLAYMMHKYGIDSESIISEISRVCGKK